MQIRSIAIASIALFAAAAAFAGETAPKVAPPQPAPRQETLLKEVTAGMREILRAVSPEISLPALDVRLPALTPQSR